MAQLKEIIEIDRQRDLSADSNVIHLFQEGSFYRAYEWSAWLCVTYVNSLMKVTHKPIKNSNETFCFVGFPVSSLDDLQKLQECTMVNECISEYAEMPFIK